MFQIYLFTIFILSKFTNKSDAVTDSDCTSLSSGAVGPTSNMKTNNVLLFLNCSQQRRLYKTNLNRLKIDM